MLCDYRERIFIISHYTRPIGKNVIEISGGESKWNRNEGRRDCRGILHKIIGLRKLRDTEFFYLQYIFSIAEGQKHRVVSEVLAQPWPGWLSWLEHRPVTQRLPVGFHIRHVPEVTAYSLSVSPIPSLSNESKINLWGEKKRKKKS